MNAPRKIELPTHTREEFYELERFSSTRHEFYAGHIIAKVASTPYHGRIIGAAIRVFGHALQNRRCFAIPNEQMVRIEDDNIDAYPDVVVYCEDAAFDARFSRTLVEPLVLIEVLSPSTQNVDRTTKMEAYFKLPTLTDYLIVWQDKIRLDQFVRTSPTATTPRLTRHLHRDSRVRLDALDIEFSLGALYRFLDDLPEGVV